jgi:uncharacterized protein (TIGR02099 family)
MKNLLNRTHRILVAATIALAVVLALAVVALRYWFIPNAEEYRPRIAQAASAALGQEVQIGTIAMDWRGPRLHLVLHDVAVLGADSQAALRFAKVETTLAWLSLLSGEVRLYALTLDGPQLTVVRDANGKIRVAGMDQEGDGGFADWLLAQREVVVRDAIVLWHDVSRGPPLKLERVDLVLTNSGSRHRLALLASPPPMVAARIDFRADVEGRSSRDIADWRGDLYLQTDSADVAQLRSWIDVPEQLTGGVAAVHAWASFRDRRFSEVTADLALSKVKAQLAEDLPEAALQGASGRVVWKAIDGGFRIDADNFALSLNDSTKPAQLSIKYVSATANSPAQGEMKVDELDIAQTLQFGNNLALSRPEELENSQLAGKLSDVAFKWRGELNAPTVYHGAFAFSNVSLAAQAKLPGAKNLSGSMSLNEDGGELRLDSLATTLELPLVFREPLQFDRLLADVAWARTAGPLELTFRKIELANAHLEGTASGMFRAEQEGRGYADFGGRLARADARAVWRYIPLKIGAATREWLQEALVAGHSDDVAFRLKGDLDNFPFGQSGDEIFEVTAKAKNGVLKYVDDWPPLENVNADLTFRGRSMEATVENATLFGAKIPTVRAEIPDLVIDDELLQMSGEAQAATSRFLAFVEKTPVAQMIDRFTHGMSGEGDGSLHIKIEMPLRHREDTKIEGAYTFHDNTLSTPDLPELSAINGRLKFTESSATLEPTAAVLLGGPINIAATAKEGAGISINASGRADIEALKTAFSHSVLGDVRGTTDWRGSLDLRNKLANFTVESDLVGITSELPAPFKKNPGETAHIRIERTQPALNRDHIAVTYGTTAALRAQRVLDRNEIERAALTFGGPAVLPERKSVVVSGKLASVNLDEWNRLFQSGGNQTLPDRTDVDLRLGTMHIGGRDFNGLHIAGTRQSQNWTGTVNGQGIAGALYWKAGTPKGSFTARFSELLVPETPDASKQKSTLTSDQMPAVDVIAESFTINGKRFGRLELIGVPDNEDWRIDKLNLSNPDGTLQSAGVWKSAPERTDLKVDLQVSDIGGYLARYDYPEGVKNGQAEIKGDLSWPGSPMDFEFSKLDGELILVAKKGRFAKLRPGLGKLLGLVSLQALPRRIKLDFRDIFSEGFEFDTIAGELKIDSGVMSTDDFMVRGTAGRVLMKGDVDLEDETQTLAVKVTPTLGDTVAIAAAIANPIAGVATYIASKVLKDPLDQFLSYEYSVRGSWEEPVVAKISRAPEAPNPLNQ